MLAAETLPYLVVEFLRVVADVLQHRAKVFQVEQQQPVVVGDLENERQHARLRLVQIEHARQQQRAHVGDGGADRMALLAENVPEHGRAAGERGSSMPSRLRRSRSLGDAAPGCVMPERSPLTSAMNTGTPIREKRSAITCSVTSCRCPSRR